MLSRSPASLRMSHPTWLALASAMAIGVGMVAAVEDLLVIAALFAASLFIWVAASPIVGVYAYFLLAPLVVGIARGSVIPIIRPNEALLLLIVGAIAARIFFRMLAGRAWRHRIHPVEISILLLAITGSVLPLIAMFGRGRAIDTGDILYAFVLWKYLLLFICVREAVRTEAEIWVCLKLILCSAVIVALGAILQVAGLFGIAELFNTYYDQPFSNSSGGERGTSTLASSFGVASVMAMCLAIVFAWNVRWPDNRMPLLAAGALFLLGCIAAGQFSGFLGLAIVLGACGMITGRVRDLLFIALPAMVAGMIALWPVIENRLAAFSGPFGLPQSWVARMDNLERFVLPELLAGFNWLLGARPAARIAAPEAWRDWIFIESGYVWLLWTGGIPMVLAFIYFAAQTMRSLLSIARTDNGAIGIAAVASAAWLVAMVILMIFDPHLTMRGSADLFFPLLALAISGRNSDPNARP